MSSRCARRGQRWASAKRARASCTAARSRTCDASSPSTSPPPRRASRTRSRPKPATRAPLARHQRRRALRRKEHFGPETQSADVRHPYREAQWREQLAHALAICAGEEWREIIEDRVRDRAELEAVASQRGCVRGEQTQSLVLPPHVLRAVAVMRDVQPALPCAALDSAVAEKRAEYHLDLHRVRYDAPEYALRMLPHTSYVGLGLLPYVLARSASATSSGP